MDTMKREHIGVRRQAEEVGVVQQRLSRPEWKMGMDWIGPLCCTPLVEEGSDTPYYMSPTLRSVLSDSTLDVRVICSTPTGISPPEAT